MKSWRDMVVYTARSADDFKELENAMERLIESYSIEMDNSGGSLAIEKGLASAVNIAPASKHTEIEKVIPTADSKGLMRLATPDFLSLDIGETKYHINYKVK